MESPNYQFIELSNMFIYIYIYIWLVVLTILKNIKVNGKDYPIYDGKIKHVPNHQPVYIYYIRPYTFEPGGSCSTF